MRRLVSLILLITLLSACNLLPRSDQSFDGMTISFAAWESERPAYETLAAQFSSEYPDVRVVVVAMEDLMQPAEGEPDTPLRRLRRVVSGADTASSWVAPPEAFGTDLLLNLAPLMAADESFDRSDFYPGMLEQYTFDGGTWVLPRYFYAQALTYNRDLFVENDLPEPEPGWRWSDLLDIAGQLADGRDTPLATYGLVDQSNGIQPLLALLQAQGVDLMNTPLDQVQLDQPGTIAALEQLRTLSAAGAILLPDLDTGRSRNARQLVQAGQAALWGEFLAEMTGTSGRGASAATVPLPFEIGRVPYPVDSPHLFGFGQGSGYIISGGTRYPQAAWHWIEFLSRQPLETPTVPSDFAEPGRIPARGSLAEELDFWAGLDEHTAAAYRWAIGNPSPLARQSPDPRLPGLLTTLVQQVIGAGADPVQAVAAGQQQIQAQLAAAPVPPPSPLDLGPVVVATPPPLHARDEVAEITFAATGVDAEEMRQLAETFQQERPDIAVTLEATHVFTEPVALTDIAGASDCFLWWSVPRHAEEREALLDLQPLLDADSDLPRSDYPAAWLTPFREAEGLFGLPYSVVLRALHYNRTAFDAADLEPPTAAWTPENFLTAAQALTMGEGDQKQYGYAPLGGASRDLLFFIQQFGGQVITGSGANARLNFADPQVIAAVQWYLDLDRVHGVTPPLTFPYRRDDPHYDDTARTLAQAGRVGLWFGESAPLPPGVESATLPFDEGIAPLPVGANGLHTGDFGVQGLYISAETRQAEACWDWLKFLSGDGTLSMLRNSLPARVSVAQSAEFITQAQPDILTIAQAYGEVLNQPVQPGGAFDVLDGTEAFTLESYWFLAAINAVLTEEADLVQALTQAQNMTTAFIDCQLAGSAPDACALQVDPDYQGFLTVETQ